MPKDLLMPALSPTMEFGNLRRWLVKEGQEIKSGDLLAEIETDKATMEWESTDNGVIGKLLVAEGSRDIAVNSLVAILLDKGEIISETSAVNSIDNKSANKTMNTSSSVDVKVNLPQQQSCQNLGEARIKASPVARKLAAQSELDLSNIKGTGPGNRIIKSDILADQPLKNAKVGDTIKNVSNMRRIVAARLTESKSTIPHFYLEIECCLDELLRVRELVNAELAKVGHKITVNDFAVKAVAMAIKDNPGVNVAWQGDSIIQYGDINICVAVSVDDGLVAPVIRNADRQSIVSISNTIKTLVIKARGGKILPEDMHGGTFSVSNLGMYGISRFSAIINPPQAGILALGSGVTKPVVKNGSMCIATIMSAVLSVDHRSVDGALGAQFLASFKGYIENPVAMLAL